MDYLAIVLNLAIFFWGGGVIYPPDPPLATGLCLCKVCGALRIHTGRVCYVVLLIVDEQVQKAGV